MHSSRAGLMYQILNPALKSFGFTKNPLNLLSSHDGYDPYIIRIQTGLYEQFQCPNLIVTVSEIIQITLKTNNDKITTLILFSTLS